MKLSGQIDRRPGAFTLIEVLLAVVIFAVALAAINGVFHGALRLRNQITQSIEQALPIQHALQVIRRDLAGLMPPGGELAQALRSEATVDGMGGVSGGGVSGAQKVPEFYTSTGGIDLLSPWSEVQRVTYYLRDPRDRGASGAGRDLIRATTRNLLPSTTLMPEEQRLLQGVDLLEFLYFDGTTWRDAWDSTTETAVVPAAIKVRLRMAPSESMRSVPASEQRVFEVVAPLVIQVSTNTPQLAGGNR